jgi:hypothetical protein
VSTKQALAETVAMQHRRIDELEAQLAEARELLTEAPSVLSESDRAAMEWMSQRNALFKALAGQGGSDE